MIITPVFFLMLFVVFCEWIVVERGYAWLRPYTKIGSIVLIITWFTQVSHWQGATAWFGIALVCSALGDFFLILPKRFFLFGLVAFASAHIFYLVGFNAAPIPGGWIPLAMAVAVFTLSYFATKPVREAMATHPELEKMRIPSLFYIIIISLMFISALMNLVRPGWDLRAAILTAVGGALFVASDAMLSRERFVKRFPHSRLLVMSTYHLGQIAIAAGVLMQYVK